MLRVSDMVATLPGARDRAAVAEGSFVIPDLPYEPLAAPVEMVWRQRAEHDAGRQWLLVELISAVNSANDRRAARHLLHHRFARNCMGLHHMRWIPINVT